MIGVCIFDVFALCCSDSSLEPSSMADHIACLAASAFMILGLTRCQHIMENKRKLLGFMQFVIASSSIGAKVIQDSK